MRAPIIVPLITLAFSATFAGCSGKVVKAFPDNFVGVGLELTMKQEIPIVVRALAGSPAAKAGLEPEDQLLAINDHPTEGQTLADIVVQLRGQAGSSVFLTMLRKGVQVRAEVVRSAMIKTGSDYVTTAHAGR